MLTKAIARGGTALAKTVRELYHAGQTDYYLEPIGELSREEYETMKADLARGN